MASRAETGPAAVHDLRVSEEGIRFRTEDREDRAVDVRFDGRRVWSFWLLRDTRPEGQDRLVPWPPALRRFLNGSTELSLADHVTGTPMGAVEARLGDREERIAVVDRDGRPLGLDKSLSLSRLFDSRDADQVAPLLDSIDTVLEALREAGIDAFLAYGTLLGAVREGGLIGHDSDADLGYVSRWSEPADAILESFRLQRRLVEQGYWVVRYSGMAFRVNVTEADGALRGLDVFGGILRDGRLYLMGEVGARFERSWIHPLGEATLQGRRFPVPAAPERLLEAMYGPHWRTPDPAFKFETSEDTRRHLDGWFRGTRGGRHLTWQRPASRRLRRVKVRPSALLEWVLDREPHVGTLVDLGCGSGADAYWMAGRGVTAWGLDFRPSHYRVLADRASAAGLPVTYRWTNLNELRSVLPVGAELAREPGPRVVVGRHIADAVDERGREGILRLAAMVTRPTGRLYLQVLRAKGRASAEPGEDLLTPLDVDALVAEVEATGGRLVMRQDLVEKPLGPMRRAAGYVDVGARAGVTEVSRLGVTWE